MKKKLQQAMFRITKEQKTWLKKESKRWAESQSQIIRSLINSRINLEEKEHAR